MEVGVNYRQYYARYARYFRRLGEAYQRPEVRASVEVLLSLLTVSFFAVFALRPTVNTILGLVSSIRGQRETLSGLDQKITNLEIAQNVWASETPRIVLLDQAMPGRPEPDRYLMQLEGLASQFGLTVSQVSFAEVSLVGKQPEKSEVANGGVSVTVTGEYSALISFLGELENLRRVLRVSSISFGRSELGTISLTVEGKIPFYHGQVPLP